MNFNTPQSEYKKIRVYDMEIYCEPLQLSLDYVDIDFFYYLNLRYTEAIAPAMENYWAPYDFLPKEEKSEKGSNKS